jgi:hypothetical protein
VADGLRDQTKKDEQEWPAAAGDEYAGTAEIAIVAY